jgi:putative ABC transport system ATP-binding protein
MESVIQLEDVWKRYDMGKAGGLTVLQEVDLEINKGEFVAITGPSGSGKSTIMHLVGALDTPSWGGVYLKKKNIKNMNETSLAVLRGKTIGFIFQQFNLLPTFSALENVMIPMELVNMPEKEARARAEYLLKLIGLEDRMHHKPTELSGGQQQRVAIARSLANDPEVILADEPTGNLDSKTGKFVMDFLSKLNKEGKTIILVTHDLGLVEYASKIVYIKDGMIEKIVYHGKGGKKNGK